MSLFHPKKEIKVIVNQFFLVLLRSFTDRGFGKV